MTLLSRVAVVLTFVLVGCGGAGSGVRPAPEPVVPAPAGPDIQSLARSNNTFGLTLWSRLRTEPGNLAMSPASISLALGMTYAGARGETATQMKQTLALELPDARVHAGLGDTIAYWNGGGHRAYELKVANRLFANRSTTFAPEFLAITRDAYRAPAEPLDFESGAEASRARINAWVEGQTRNRIRDLLPSGSISPDVRMVLVNAIYFKGAWVDRFDTADTRDGVFHVAPGRDVTARMMSQTGTFAYAQAEGVQLLEMPYVGDALSMVVVLPNEAAGLAAVEAGLDAARFDGWVAGLHSTDDVMVSMPRFRIDPPAPLSLAGKLSEMGMPLAFDETADFTGILPRTNGGLWISDVFHKAFVEVNEEGTEAAAATAVVMLTDAVAETPSFVADHPFLFFVRDRRTGAILFMGRVVEPSA